MSPQVAEIKKALTPDQLADKCEAWLQSKGASNIVDAYEEGYREAERSLLEEVEGLRKAQEWQPIETAPLADEGNFLVLRHRHPALGADWWVEEVFAFEGQMYPARLLDGIDWDERVTDASHWVALPDVSALSANKGDA